MLPGWGLVHTLPRLMGPGRALDFMWTGRTLGAAEAARTGLVDRLLGDDSFEDELDAYINQVVHLISPLVLLAGAAGVWNSMTAQVYTVALFGMLYISI